MQSYFSKLNILKGNLRIFFLGILTKVLPNRMKRMMFISSLYARIGEMANPDVTVAHKLNQLMRLSDSEGALLLPMYLSKLIWKNDVKVQCFGDRCVEVNQLRDVITPGMTPSQKRIISDQLVKVAPKWLQYGSHRFMKHDLIVMLNNMQVA